MQNLTLNDHHFNHFLFIHLFEEAITEEVVIPPSTRKSTAGWSTYLEIKRSMFNASTAWGLLKVHSSQLSKECPTYLPG